MPNVETSQTPPQESPTEQPLLVAVLTPHGRGAVATVAVVGRGAVEVVDRLFHPLTPLRLAAAAEGRILYGRWGGEQGEEVVACRVAAEVVEVHCHGGVAASAALVQSLEACGAKAVSWQQLLRLSPASAAVIPGQAGPLQNSTAARLIGAEAMEALAQCRTRKTAALLLTQAQGAMEAAVRDAQAHLAQGEVDAARSAIETLLAQAPVGLHLTQPWQVVLTGQPNVGKSSLLNRLLGYARAIVTDRPGTTRDTIAEGTALDGWPVTLVDTAGLREADDPLEAAGVALTQQEAAQADLVVLVFDASQPWGAADQELLERFPHALRVHNKSDLRTAGGEAARPAGLKVSALTGQGTEALAAAIAAALVPDPPPADAALPFTHRQVSHLEAALRHLPGNVPTAQEELARLLGEA